MPFSLVHVCAVFVSAASNGRALNAEEGVLLKDNGNGNGNGNAGGDGSGAGSSSDVRSDSSISSRSGSEPRGVASDHDAADDPPLGGGDVAVGNGGIHSPAQPLVGEQRAAAAAAAPVARYAGDVDSSRASGSGDGHDKPGVQEGNQDATADMEQEVRKFGRLKREEGEHGRSDGAGAAGAADEEGSELVADADVSSIADKESSGACEASTASSAPGDLPDAAGPGAEAALVVRDNDDKDDAAIWGDSASSEAAVGKSVGSASSQPAASAAQSVQAMIEALPPGFVRCPGCPMVSGNEVWVRRLKSGYNLNTAYMV